MRNWLLCSGHLGCEFIHVINKNICEGVVLGVSEPLFFPRPWPSQRSGANWHHMNIFNTDNVGELSDAWPGNCRGDVAEVLPDSPGAVSAGLHPSGRLCIGCLADLLLLTCHRGRCWDQDDGVLGEDKQERCYAQTMPFTFLPFFSCRFPIQA